MGDNRTEELRTQYEDAMVALFMDEYAQDNGARLLAEFEEAQKNGSVPEMSPELEEKCWKQIQKRLDQRSRLQKRKQLIRKIGQIAAAFLIVMGLSATLVVSVDAFREPIVNFILGQREHANIAGYEDPKQPQETGNSEISLPETPLAGLLPTGYALKNYITKNDGTFFDYYENEMAELVTLHTVSGNGMLSYDVEDAETKQICINGYDGILIEKGEYKLIWYVPKEKITYQLRATGLSLDELWQIAEDIAQRSMEE